jgi:hypothetical protein
MRRGAWPAMLQEISTYTLQQVRALESALFSFFVLAAHEPVQKAARHAAALLEPGEDHDLASLVAELQTTGAADQDLIADLQKIAMQRSWIEQPPSRSERDPESFKPDIERLQAIYDQTRALRRRVEALIEQGLAGAGLSASEIKIKTEETARLWLAA